MVKSNSKEKFYYKKYYWKYYLIKFLKEPTCYPLWAVEKCKFLYYYYIRNIVLKKRFLLFSLYVYHWVWDNFKNFEELLFKNFLNFYIGFWKYPENYKLPEWSFLSRQDMTKLKHIKNFLKSNLRRKWRNLPTE